MKNQNFHIHRISCFLIVGFVALQTCFAGVIRQSFHYDETGRLIEVRSDTNPELSEAYRYDGSGNIIEKRQGDEVIKMDYDQANQLKSRTDAKGTVDFVYDSAGRMIEERQGSEILARYEYGYLDKVILVTRGNEVTKFHYNARGMLVAKERNGKIIETMAWDGIGLLAKGDTGYVNEAHISGGVPLMSVSQGENTFYDNDYLGTTTAVYNREGETDVKLTGSLGRGTKDENTRFTGKSFDEDLGAHVFPFRNYRSDMGRWTSADPAGFPDGPNRHFYAPVPTSGLDPLGLKTVYWVAVEIIGFEGQQIAAAVTAHKTYLNQQDTTTSSTSNPTHYLDDGDTLSSITVTSFTALSNIGNGVQDVKIYIAAHGSTTTREFTDGSVSKTESAIKFLNSNIVDVYGCNPTDGVINTSQLVSVFKLGTNQFLEN